MPNKMWDEITYTFPNLIGRPIEVWQWRRIFIPTPYWACDYLSMLGLKLNQGSTGDNLRLHTASEVILKCTIIQPLASEKR